MRTIARGSFQGTNAELHALVQARVDAFKQALDDHAKTVGRPAPREEDLIEDLARSGEAFEIELDRREVTPLTPEQQREIDLATKRAAALQALDDARLQAAAADPKAPQEVKDYAVARAEAGAL